MAQASITGTYQGDKEAIALDVKATFDSFLARINSVTNEQVAVNAISTDKIINAAVTLAKILDASFTANAAGRAKFAAKFITRALQDDLALGAGAHFFYRHAVGVGVNGGTSVTTTWNKRLLNVLVDHESIGAGAPSSGVFILPAGDYDCNIVDLIDGGNGHMARLRNTTSGTTLIAGTTGNAGSNSMGASFLIGRFTVASAQNLEVQHFVESGVATFGMGRAVNSGSPGEGANYCNAEFWKVA